MHAEKTRYPNPIEHLVHQDVEPTQIPTTKVNPTSIVATPSQVDNYTSRKTLSQHYLTKSLVKQISASFLFTLQFFISTLTSNFIGIWIGNNGGLPPLHSHDVPENFPRRHRPRTTPTMTSETMVWKPPPCHTDIRKAMPHPSRTGHGRFFTFTILRKQRKTLQ